MRVICVFVFVVVIVGILSNSVLSLTGEQQRQVVDRARQEVNRRVLYDPSYKRIKYPGGDIDSSRGVCADVIVRALRAIGLDLQKAICEDRKNCPKAYGKGHPDRNLDHRRCRNQIIWMKRQAEQLTVKAGSAELSKWQSGDLVYWDLDGKGLLHVGVISNMKGIDGITPRVIHNIGPYATENDVLPEWKIIYHFRVKAPIIKPAAKRASVLALK